MKVYNDNKICFIICANQKQYLEECLLYLGLLEVPERYETELLVIEDVKSVAAAYNEGMKTSDAQYKIYLQQDVLVTERKILQRIIDIFQKNKQIGLLGVVGAERLPKDGIVSHGCKCGALYMTEEYVEEIEYGYKAVDAVDGMFMATQYDIPWREDLLQGQVLFDTSQSLEFQKAGYKVVIPAQSKPWVIKTDLEKCPAYPEEQRLAVLQEYHEFFGIDNRLRILFIHSTNIFLAGLLSALMEMGHEVIELPRKINIADEDLKEREYLEEVLEEGHFDLVVTYDFGVGISNACQNQGVKYYAWVYDSPLLALYTQAARNSMNYISVFDKKQYERLQEENIPHLKHIPLATETNLFGAVEITKEDEKEYSADVSFLGNLYDKRGFEQIFGGDCKELLEEAEEILQGIHCKWSEKETLFDKASVELISYMVSKLPANTFATIKTDERYFCESMVLARKCNEYERIAVMNEVAKKYQMVLYTTKTEQPQLENVEIRPAVQYLTVMPKVFYLSKINLNITSRSIETGIPQRVWDIMAVGGFCLTNYQPELEDYFEIGKDLDVFHDLEELMEKIGYYLSHEEARVRIALNGYKKVHKLHSYVHRMKDILKWVVEK